jgi:hypothetical protein
MNTQRPDPLSIRWGDRRPLTFGFSLSAFLHTVIIVVFVIIPLIEAPKERVIARIEWEEEDTPFAIPEPRLVKEFAFKKQRIPEGISLVIRSSGDQTATIVGGGGGGGGIRMADAPQMWSGPGGSSRFVVAVSATGGLGDAVVGIPQFEAVTMTSLKEPEKRIDMQAEFLDLTALDTGKYKGMVIQDPRDKQSIKGFVYLATVWGSVLEPANKLAISQLVRAINGYTSIKAEVDDQMLIDSPDLFKAPFVLITANRAFELTEHESENLSAYLRSGGFVLADNATPTMEYGPAEASLRKMFTQALGRDARFVPLPNNHPIYHAFFDFDGPPPGGDIGSPGGGANLRVSHPVNFLEGIYLRDRLVAIYSDKGYGAYWEAEYENEPQLKMGVNFVVFALTQKGSIAQQQIDFYSEAKR